MLGRFTNAARASSTLLGRSPAQTLQRPQLARLAAPTNLLPRRSASSSTREVKIKGPGKLEVAFADGGKPAKFEQVNTLWLRDNCQCSQCINQDTRQRNFDTFELSPELAPVSVNHTPTHVFVEWSDSHKSEHPWPWLETWFDKSNPSTFGEDHKTIRWTPSLADSPPEVSYKKIMDPNDTEGMAQLTRQIWQHGFTFIVDTPVTPEATEAVLEKIGPIRTTHYGGFYDFIPDLALADTAYTNLALPAHTDTTYFSEPAGLQAFHLLSHTPPPDAGQSGKQPLGGKSLLVDGFNAAQELKETHPESYKILRDSKIPWHASGNQGIAIVPDRTYPVIEEDDSVLARVRWNNDDRGVVPPENAQAWYAAAAKWNAILRKKENEFWFQLKPGSVVIFNNWRIMHGRSAFDGVRRICGAYIPRDDFVSRYRTSNFSHEDVIGRNLHMNTKKV